MLLVPCRRRLIFIITQACRSRDREGSTQDREELWHPGLRGRQAMEDSSAGIRQFLRWPWDWSFRLSAQFMVEPNIQMWRYRVRWQASTWLIIYIYIYIVFCRDCEQHDNTSITETSACRRWRHFTLHCTLDNVPWPVGTTRWHASVLSQGKTRKNQVHRETDKTCITR